MIRQIVVGFHDVETAREATKEAANLAFQLGAKLHVVSAVEDGRPESVTVGSDRYQFSAGDQIEGVVRRFVRSLGLDLDPTVAVVEGSPGEVLVAEAERIGADLIVVGNVRMQGPRRLLGSVGNHVTHNAPCSVLVVKTE